MSARERLKRTHTLLMRAEMLVSDCVDWCSWTDEEPGRGGDALRRIRPLALRLLVIAVCLVARTWRGR